ncbi:MAG: Serine/threonine-protein kinase PknB [Planctomycetota bacterium]
MAGETGSTAPGVAPDAVLLSRAVERGLISSDQARTIAERTLSGATAADLLIDDGLLTRHLVDTLSRDGAGGTVDLGRTLGGFDLGEVLGEGGMGSVYRAVQRSLGRPVALKVISGAFAKDPEFAERFLREARAAAAINHPNVITCIDVGTAGDRLYMALELVTGGDAAQLAKRCGGHLPEHRAVEIAADAARGLCAIARAGLIHRDIKPSNIFICDDGAAKLADLGLARTSAGDDRMTVTGRAMGTPAFMSPEQARGAADIDIRSDIYALGATLYALATGHAPFEGTSPWVVVAKVLNDEPEDPRRRVRGLSDGFALVVARAMAKDRAQRYPTPEHLVADLERLLQGAPPLLDQVQPATGALRRPPSTLATITVQRPRRRWPWLVAGVLAAVAGGVAVLLGPGAGATAAAGGSATAAVAAGSATTTGGPQVRTVTAAPPPPPVVRIPPEAIAAATALAARLQAAGSPAATVAARPDGTLVVRGLAPGFRDPGLLAGQPVAVLSLAGCRRIDDLRPFAGLPLRDLDLTGLDGLDDLRGLESVPLERLILEGCDDLDGGLEILRGKPLRELSLRGCASLERLTGIEGAGLVALDISGCTGLRKDLLALHGMPLRILLARGTGIASLTGLSGLPLTRLDLAGSSRLVRIGAIRDLPLAELDLSDCPRIEPEEGAVGGILASLPWSSLRRLDLSGNGWVTDLSPLSGSRIERLGLARCRRLTGDLAALSGLPLGEVDLTGSTGLTGLGGIANAPLRRLVVTDAGRIAEDAALAPFLGRSGLVIIR